MEIYSRAVSGRQTKKGKQMNVHTGSKAVDRRRTESHLINCSQGGSNEELGHNQHQNQQK